MVPAPGSHSHPGLGEEQKPTLPYFGGRPANALSAWEEQEVLICLCVVVSLSVSSKEAKQSVRLLGCNVLPLQPEAETKEVSAQDTPGPLERVGSPFPCASSLTVKRGRGAPPPPMSAFGPFPFPPKKDEPEISHGKERKNRLGAVCPSAFRAPGLALPGRF